MGQAVAKPKQGAAEQATQKTDEKDGKAAGKTNDAKELINFMEQIYDRKIKPGIEFDDFYHAIHDMVEKFCEERGQLQYKIPPREELERAYKNVHRKDGKNLTREEFMKITENIIKVDSFTFGKAAIDVLMVLFGAPVCALFIKRVIPGLKSFSDDVVIPVATSGAVVYLAKTNKL
ncbi:hypothetical protein BRADI_2g26860v3 [Brachypodium distachyon]|uniref:Uncharacterized protein n=1 Tax=Brachypodium distachyon TaxID=15368 RepID=A0A2K2DAS2_BRADI|nr:hypothetical protein BRADI_2g26860v3 [Brachypodium distachyon]